MINKLAVAAFVGAVSFASAALADDIPATPMNHGPMRVNGMGPVGDVVNIGMTPVNVVAPGVITVSGAVGGGVVNAVPSLTPVAAAPEAVPVRKHRRHRYARHRMVKKAM